MYLLEFTGRFLIYVAEFYANPNEFIRVYLSNYINASDLLKKLILKNISFFFFKICLFFHFQESLKKLETALEKKIELFHFFVV